MDCQYRKIL